MQPARSPQAGMPGPLAEVLVVTADWAQAAVDRAMLRRMGPVRTRTFASGRAALAHLADLVRQDAHNAALAMVGQTLEDMTGLDFLRRARSVRALAALPVLALSQDPSREAVLDAAAAGCSGFLLRPYSLHTLERSLSRARRSLGVPAASQAARPPRAGSHPAASQDPAPGARNDARRHYEEGMALLGARRYDPAIAAFNRAVALDAMFAEAHLGLARAWLAKGFPDRHRLHARKAAECYARMDCYAEARRIFVDVLKIRPELENPFLELADRLVRQGDCLAAASAALQALGRTRDKAGVYARLKRACHFTPDPMRSARQVAEALAQGKGRREAEAVLRRIMGDAEPGRCAAETVRAGRDDPVTRMNEWWAVIKWTWKAFLNDAPLGPPPEPLEI